VLGCAGAGLYGHGAQGRGAALGEDDAVDAGSVGYAEKSAEILRVFDAVQGEDEAVCLHCRWIGGEEVFDGEEFLGADEGDYALVSRGLGELGKLLAGFLPDADAGLAGGGNEALEAETFALFEALAGDEDLVEAAAAGLQGFFNRVHAVEDFHVVSVED